MATVKLQDLSKREAKLAYLLLVPSIIILILIAFYPLGSVFYASTTNREFASPRPTEYVGLQNYAKLLGVTVQELPPLEDEATGAIMRDEQGNIVFADAFDVLPRSRQGVRYRNLTEFTLFGTKYVLGATEPAFLRAIGDTIQFTVISVLLETVLGLLIALVLHSHFKGRGALRAVMLIPWAVPTAVSSRMWEWMFASSRVGFFNVIGQQLGLTDGQFPFLTDSGSQIWIMIIIDVWKTTPFMALLLLAGLQMIPTSIYEAARVDGASTIRRFFSMTLPMLKPTMAVALVFRTLDALRVFDLFQIVFGRSRFSMASFSYYQLISNRAMGYSSAASVIIFVIILLFILLYMKVLGGTSHE